MEKKILNKRLAPLYVSDFFQGLVFWYAIEKVLMVHIGFTPSLIAVNVIAISVVGLLLEIPSGIAADRWSRKGVLLLACCALLVGTLLLGLSHSVIAYIVASCLYGAYFALRSGMTDTIIYDVLIEVQGERRGYEKYLGRSTLLASLAVAIGSFFGGFIAHAFGLQAAYFLSLPSAVLAVISLCYFKEPTIHKQLERSKLTRHIGQTLRIVFQKGTIAWLLLSVVCFGLLSTFILQLGQLWALSLHLNLRLYGPLDALLLIGLGVGGPLAGYIVRRRSLTPLLYVFILLATGLLTLKNLPLVVIGQFGIITLSTTLYTMIIGRFHDALPSSLRSGSSSVSGTLTSLTVVPLVFLFGKLIDRVGISHASYMLVPIAAIGVFSTVKIVVKAKA